MMNYIKMFVFMSAVFTVLGCGKLDVKPDSSMVLPSTARELELLLDNADVINLTPALPQVSADEYLIPDEQSWASLSNATSRNAAIWQKDIYGGETAIRDWSGPYSAVFYANNVLEVLSGQDISQDVEKQVIKGWALFVRAYSNYMLLSTFAPGYSRATAQTDLGIPIRLEAGVDQVLPRSSVKQGYDQVILDALEASGLLQDLVIAGKRNRPSKAAAFAFLARVYLSMREYDKAEEYADLALGIYSVLTDFNTLSKTGNPFTFDTQEVIYYSEQLPVYTDLTGNRIRTGYGVDLELLALYGPNDLRRTVYFQRNTLGNYNMRQINSLGNRPFTGLATDEIYLIRAECLARRSEISGALAMVNAVLEKRWDQNATVPAGPFQPVSAGSAEQALELVLTERRRALVWRGLRWTDLKRLNLEGREIVLNRSFSGQSYRLEPNSPRYVMPIPDEEIAMSGLSQNER